MVIFQCAKVIHFHETEKGFAEKKENDFRMLPKFVSS